MKYYNVKPDKKPGPYERFLELGPDSLSDAELIAIILRTGTAGEDTVSISNKILGLSDGRERSLLNLYHLSIEELMTIKGIGRVKAIKLKCVAELSSRMAREKARGDISYQRPETIAGYYMETMRHWDHEGVMLMMLDGRYHLLADTILGKGTARASLISPREVIVTSLKHNAVFIILLHNHPGGDPTPSEADIEATKRVKFVSELADIPLADHIIIGDNCYYSFRESGQL